jgi:hypothetical protein
MNDLRAIGGFAYIRSIIGIVLARLIYNTSVFISQLDRRFVIHVIMARAKVAHTLQFVAIFIAEDDAHPGGDDVVCALGVRTLTVRPRRPESKSFDRLTGNRNAIPVVQHLHHIGATTVRGKMHVYRTLEGALGWLSVRRMITVTCPVRIGTEAPGVPGRRRATPGSIKAAVVLVLQGLGQIQAGHGRGYLRGRKLLEHTTAERGRTLSVYGGDGAGDPGGL